MRNTLLSFAYYLAGNEKYLKTKHYIRGILGDATSFKKKVFDLFMIFLVLSTVGILIYEIKHEVPPAFDTFELYAIFIFIIEWLLRLWTSSDIHQLIILQHEQSQKYNTKLSLYKTFKTIMIDKLSFIFSPMSIIDLLAILPSYRPLRVLRIFLLFRLFKVLRYTKSITQFTSVIYEKRFDFFTLGLLVGFILFFASTVMYVYEGHGNNPNINSYFDSIYWSLITLTTVGYGDITPVSLEGKLTTLVLVICGFGVLGFSTSIIATALGEKMEFIKEQRAVTEANRLKNLILICGFGRMGETLAYQLKSEKKNFAIIDVDPKEVERAKEKDFLCIEADATSVEKLREFNNLLTTNYVIALTSSDAVNLSIVLAARSINPNLSIISRINNQSAKDKLLFAGANHVFFSYEIAAYMAVGHTDQPIAMDAVDKMSLSSDGASIEEIEVTSDSHLLGLKLQKLKLHTKHINLIGIKQKGAKKENFIFNPDENYTLKLHDSLVLIGWKEDILMLQYRLER